MTKTLLISLLVGIFSFSWAQEPSSLMPVKVNYKWGFIEKSGKIAIEPAYDYTENFICNLAKVKIKGKYGVIDQNGKLIVPANEDAINIYCPNYISIREDTLWGMDDATGKKLLKTGYHSIAPLTSTTFLITKGGLSGIYNAYSNILIEPAFNGVTVAGEFLLIQKDTKVGLFNTALETILNPENTQIEVADNHTIMVKQKDFWALVNNKGESVLKPEWMAYRKLDSNYVMLKAKVGGWALYSLIINKIISTELQENYNVVDNELIMTTKAGKHGIIDKNGTTILGRNFSNIHLSEGLLLVEQTGKWGLSDRKGKLIIPTIHDKLFPFKKNVAIFQTGEGKGVIDNKGKILVQPQYASIDIKDKTAFCYKEDGSSTQIKLEPSSKTLTSSQKKYQTSHAWLKGGPFKKWGLLGHDTIFIPYKFDEVFEKSPEFSLAAVKFDYRSLPKLYGYINQQKLSDMTSYKLALIDKISGKTLLQPTAWYIRTEDFDMGLNAKVVFEGGQQGLVSIDGKIIQDYSYLNRENKVVKQPINYIGQFYDNIAAFCIGCNVNYSGNWESNKIEGGKWGYITQEGLVVMEPQFEEAGNFSNGRAVVKLKGMNGLVATDGSYILKPDFASISFIEETANKYIQVAVKKEKFGLINQEGKVIADVIYEKIFPFKEGLARVMISGKYGFIDETHKLVIPASFDNAMDFSEGRAAICLNKLWGYINKSGQQEILPVTPFAGNFKNGLAPVARDGKLAYINKDGKVILSPSFEKGSDFNNGMAIVTLIDGKQGIIDTTGKYILEPKAEEIKFLAKNKFLKIRQENEWRLFEKSARKIITKKSFQDIGEFANGLAPVKLDDYYTYIDTTGKVVSSKKYSMAANYINGVARVALEGKTGFINVKGETLIQCYLSAATDFNNNRAFAEGANKQWSIIDRNGKNLTHNIFYNPQIFQSGLALVNTKNREFYFTDTLGTNPFLQKFEYACSFENDLARIKNKKWGILNNAGFHVVENKYDYISECIEGQYVVGYFSSIGITDLDGNAIADNQYDKFDYVGNGIFRLEKSDAIGYLSADKTWIWELKK